ncbi:MAG: glycine cleavage system protein GcvH [Planctomycetes bacterium]|nr:glycine cleavage system protein GcvH [Planctomycetota bacterium]
MRPTDLKFSKTHEWVRIEKDIATAGISDFAVHALSDLVYIDMPQVTDLLEQGQPYAEVESVKAVSDIYAPLSGEIVEINEELPDSLETLAKDPYGAGWIVKFRISHPGEVEGLMDAAQYEKHCKEEEAKH